ncbi:differentiation regulon [Streptomyces clavuligerus]|nr:differentiation regulon [Streptomyces clavuligerus]
MGFAVTHSGGGGVVTAETSQTLDRGLRVLKLLADTDHGLTVTELSQRLGVNRTVVYRLLATLEQHALVRRDLGGRARVGLGVLRLSRQVHPLVREAAMPALRALAEDIGATAHLTLVDGAEALAVAVVEPTWTDYHVAYPRGLSGTPSTGVPGGRANPLRPARAKGGHPVTPSTPRLFGFGFLWFLGFSGSDFTGIEGCVSFVDITGTDFLFVLSSVF